MKGSAAATSLDARVRDACASGRTDDAASIALRELGPEVYGFLTTLCGDEDRASDAFSAFSEKLWRSLPRFAWGCSLRTWAYLVARTSAMDVLRAGRRHRGAVPLSSAPVSQIAEEVRTATLSFLRTAVRDDVARVRDELPPDDRTLLVLRVDREMAFDEIARVFLDETADAASLRRESARLRKRFQLVRERIRALVPARGPGAGHPPTPRSGGPGERRSGS